MSISKKRRQQDINVIFGYLFQDHYQTFKKGKQFVELM